MSSLLLLILHLQKGTIILNLITRCKISKLESCSAEAFIKFKLKVLLEVSLLHLAYPALSSLSQKQTSNSVPHHKMPDFVCHSGKKIC